MIKQGGCIKHTREKSGTRNGDTGGLSGRAAATGLLERWQKECRGRERLGVGAEHRNHPGLGSRGTGGDGEEGLGRLCHMQVP